MYYIYKNHTLKEGIDVSIFHLIIKHSNNNTSAPKKEAMWV